MDRWLGPRKVQVVDYWNDLISSFHSKTSYFLGTVVLAREAMREDSS